jgi:two-component system chemotaxis response regulator CheB
MIVRRVNGEESLSFFYRMVVVHLLDTVKKHSADKNRSATLQSTFSKGKVIAIGSSTGGTETVLHILKLMPADAPPIVIVQHMPPVFTKLYAERADALCKIKVWEAKNSDYLANGLALIAPGGKHMTIKNHGSGLVEVMLNSDPPVWSQRPAVDVLFNSVAAQMSAKSVGVILTGMGEDGAAGLLAMRKRGAYTIGQDKESSIVYGMPKAAYERGAVAVQLPLEKIAQEILENAYK